MKTRLLAAAALVIAALTLAGIASAASIDDLKALGFTVGVARSDANCTVYVISGYGNSSYFDTCDPNFQAAIDSWANPVGFCNVKWQFEHPDQVEAFQLLQGKQYSISGDQCADRYVVVNSFTGAVLYDGPAAGMVQVAAAAPIAVAGTKDAPVNPTPTPPTCLPLCPPTIAPVDPPPPPPTPPVDPPAVTVTAPAAPAPSAEPAAVEAAATVVEANRFSAQAASIATSESPAAPLRWQDAAPLVR